LAIDDKYDADIQKLIDAGKEKGYLTYNEVNDLLPGDVNSPDDLDDLITTIARRNRHSRGRAEDRRPERDDFEPKRVRTSSSDLTPGTLEKTNDPVRMYLRRDGHGSAADARGRS